VNPLDLTALHSWCSIPADELEDHPDLRMPVRIVKDSATMGELMARELVDEILRARDAGRMFRAIVPCGPKSWYEPFCRIVVSERVNLDHLVVFHMDDCLDWQGRPLHDSDPHNFASFMRRHFYDPIPAELAVPQHQRVFPEVARIEEIKAMIAESPIDLTLGGFGQDGHVAYNQARRNPFSALTVQQLRESELRVQENAVDTVIALAERSFGGAYQFVPPMSISLGMKECLSARQVRLYSDTGSWKRTALRVALFAPETVEYPMTLLQTHPDVLVTVTLDTARHPISEHPEWRFSGVET